MLADNSEYPPVPAQEGLFAVEFSREHPPRIIDTNSPSDGDSQPAEFVPLADLRETTPHVLRALGQLAEASKLTGFNKVPHSSRADEVRRQHEAQGKSFEGFQKGAQFNKTNAMSRARQSLFLAYNVGLEQEASIDDLDFQDAFAVFSQRYGVGANPKSTAEKRASRDSAIKNLTKLQDNLQGLPGSRPETTRYHLSKEALSRVRHAESQTTKKLEILHDDPRAQFWPESNQEGTEARKVLRLTDEHPGALQNYVTDLGIKAGEKVMIAKIDEIADYTSAGMDDWNRLSTLNDQLTSFKKSKRTYITNAVGSDNTGFAPLVRFLDIESRATDPEHGQTFDPLRNRRTDFRPAFDNARHKRLHGMYTSESTDDQEFTAQRIHNVLSKMNVESAKEAVERAMDNEAARVEFWISTLATLKGRPGRLAGLRLQDAGVTLQ